jgi:hypothetical protein
MDLSFDGLGTHMGNVLASVHQRLRGTGSPPGLHRSSLPRLAAIAGRFPGGLRSVVAVKRRPLAQCRAFARYRTGARYYTF